MTHTPASTQPARPAPSPEASAEQAQRELLDELLWLARDAHERPQRDDARDPAYVRGQLNTYARAAGIVAARQSGEEPILVADRIIHALTDDADLPTLHARVTGGSPTMRRPASRAAGLEWIGPKAFEAAYGHVPGIDQDFGMHWGPARNQRISLRRELTAPEGLLYAYDPIWDEYALIAHAVPTRLVADVFLDALQRDEHLPVTEFAQLIRSGLQTRTPEPASICLVEP